MKKILLAFTMMAVGTVSASAGPIYDLGYHTSSATMKLSGDIRVAASSSSANSPTITLSGPSGITTSKPIATTSSVSADAGFYGSGLNLTEVVHSTAAIQSQVNNIAASTGVLTTDLATEVSNRMIADSALAVSTGAIAASDALKLPLAGGTLTGQLNGTSSVFSGSLTASSMSTTGFKFNGPCTLGYRLTAIDNDGNMACQPPASGVEADYFFSRDVFPVTNYNVMYTSAQVYAAISTRTWDTIPASAIVVSTFATLPNFPGLTVQPNGTYLIDFRAAKTAGNAKQKLFMFAILYRYTTGGAEIPIFTSPTTEITAATPTQYIVSGTTIAFSLDRTDRYLLRTYAFSSGSGVPLPTLALYGGNGYSTKLTTPQPAASVGTYVPWTGGAYDLDINTHKITASSAVFSGSLTASSVTVTGNISQTGVIISSGTGNNYFAGNVGISGAGDLTNKMVIYANHSTQNYLQLKDVNASPGHSYQFNYGNSGLQIYDSSVPRMVLQIRDYDGSVGIGTPTPDQKLTVAGNISQTGVIISSGTGSNYFAGSLLVADTSVSTSAFSAKGIFIDGSQSGFPSSTYDTAGIIYKTNGNGLAPWNEGGSLIYRPRVSSTAGRSSHIFYTGSPSLERLRINEAGRVGIGTTAPSAKLEVAGGAISNTGTGAGITTTGDVTAVAFHGNGSGLTGLAGGGDAVLAATQTWTGSNTFGNVNSTTTFSGWVDIGLETVHVYASATGGLTATCPSGKKVLGGGCVGTGGGTIVNSWPSTVSSWNCEYSTLENIDVYAICARIK